MKKGIFNKILILSIFILIIGSETAIGVNSNKNSNKFQLTEDDFEDSCLNILENKNILSHAEYEEVNELILSWPKSNYVIQYFLDMVRAAEKAVNIRINVNNFLYKIKLISTLNKENIPLDNITITITRTSSIWVRDYGPFFIEKNNQLSIVDFNYYGHRTRLMDDLYPTLYGIKNNIDINFMANFVLCIQGGNYMSDGQGTAIVADIPLETCNPDLSNEEIKDILKKYLGLDKVITLTSQVDDGTAHVDMFSKLIDNDIILVGQWLDTNDTNYQILENNTQLLLDLGYNVIRIPMLRDPDEDNDVIWSYTNSLIINGPSNNVVLVPQYNVEEDSDAIFIYEQVLPDYEIIGINCNEIINYTTITVPKV